LDSLTIQALQWARLADLRDVPALDQHDLACMVELREVLIRHGRLQRFALQLVHKHFDLDADEVLVEYSDPLAREQVLRVERRDAAALRGAIPTTWMLAVAQPLVACVCAYRAEHGHLGRHQSD
jgi:hypothetical protein